MNVPKKSIDYLTVAPDGCDDYSGPVNLYLKVFQ